MVNALSEWCDVEVRRNKKIYYQRYKRGLPEKKVAITGKSESTGTITRFKADEKIFDSINYSFDILSNRLRELAFLNKGVEISIVDQRTSRSKSHKFKFTNSIRLVLFFLFLFIHFTYSSDFTSHLKLGYMLAILCAFINSPKHRDTLEYFVINRFK